MTTGRNNDGKIQEMSQRSGNKNEHKEERRALKKMKGERG